MDLRTTATMAGWPTPRLADGESSGMRWGRGKADTLTAVATHLAGWPSPQAADGKGSGKNQHTVSLCQTTKAVLAGWPTPVAHDDGKTPEAHLAMKRRMGERDGTGADSHA